MKLRLISKIILSTGVLLLLSMSLYAWINIEGLRNMLMEEAISSTDKLSETIIRTTHYQMMENDLERVYQMIKEAGTQKDIKRIRLVSKEGTIICSTDDSEIGTYLDKSAEACNMCHIGNQPLLHASSMNRSRLFKFRDGVEVLGIAKAIYNEEKCYTAPCHFHPADAKILGVLDVIVSLDNMRDQLASNRFRITMLTVVMLGLISMILIMLTHELINQPLRQLVLQTERISEGDLDSRVNIDSSDEIGELASSFNVMTEKLRTARDELEDWARTLEVKVEQRTRELQRMQAQLIRSEKLASLGELVAGIAHEINNPLTGILLYSSMIAKRNELSPGVRDDLDIVIRETERCARIVRGLLQFARESVPQKSDICVNDVMEAALNLIKNQAQLQDIRIVREFSSQLPLIQADHNQLEQVFINMLLNASHAMPEGGDLTLSTGTSNDGRHLLICIRDTGHGITPENLERIFDPFFSTKQNIGTGLGLSVSYGIVNSHGGTIEVESIVGEGTAFTIKLPVGEK